MRPKECKPRTVVKPTVNQVVMSRTVVVKKLAPMQPGALKHARLYGDALVCVRYRHDAERRHRYTTVELVIERSPINRRKPSLDAIVAVHIPFNDTARQMRAKMLGARWDNKRRIWFMKRETANELRLGKHIVNRQAK